MNSKESTYRSLVMRKVQQLAKEHGGLVKIPKSIQQKLGFDVIAKRKTHTISVRIPAGDLSSKIDQLQADLPAAKAFGSSKPAPDSFRKYTPVPSFTNQTMDDFWILQGWYKQDRIGIELGKAGWKDDPSVRKAAVRFLVEKVLKKDPRDITQKDFYSNRLSGLISHYYEGSPYAALIDAGYHIKPWEMLSSPHVYESRENRTAATRWLVKKLKKHSRDITYDDFISNRLGGLLSNYYNDSPYEALLEAGYAYSRISSLLQARRGKFRERKIHFWEMSLTPSHFFDSKENRAAATKWLVWKLQKDPRDITANDFSLNRLRGVLPYCSGGPHAALVEAGYAYTIQEALKHAKAGNFLTDKIYPWEMQMSPRGTFDSKERRVAATKWLVWKLQKDPRDIMKKDFSSEHIGGNFHHYEGLHDALMEAGYAYSIDEALQHAKTGTFKTDKFYPWEMDRTPPGTYDSKETRIAVIKWLVAKLKKDPRDLTREDFESNRLGGLLADDYTGSPYAAVLEAGYAYSIDEALQHAKTGNFQTSKLYPWEMATTPMGFYESKENRVAVIKWLVWKIPKDPRDIIQENFHSNRLSGLLGCYGDSPYEAMLEAGMVTKADEQYMRSYGRQRFMEVGTP